MDIYGKVRTIVGGSSFIPFRYQGQYEDEEIGLYYNRFRYYSPDSGTYLSQDPIGLAGNNPNFYAYTFDSNSEIDPFGLECSKAKPKKDWQEYEEKIQDIYGGKLPQGQRKYTTIVKGKQVNGIADHVIDIDGKRVAIDAKYVKDWSKSIRNPNSKIT